MVMSVPSPSPPCAASSPSAWASPAPNFANLNELEEKLLAFIDEWNQQAHPFKWNQASFNKSLGKMNAPSQAAA